jgi:hypothetical protein
MPNEPSSTSNRSLPNDTIDSLAAGRSALKAIGESATEQWHRIQKHPVSRLADGIGLFLIVLVAAAIVGATTYWLTDRSLFLTILAAIVGGLLSAIIAFLSLRPIFGSVAKSLFPRLDELSLVANEQFQQTLEICNAECKAELEEIRIAFQKHAATENSRYASETDAIRNSFEQAKSRLVSQERSRRVDAAQTRVATLEQSNSSLFSQHESLVETHRHRRAKIEKEFEEQFDRQSDFMKSRLIAATTRTRDGRNSLQKVIDRLHDFDSRVFPDWNQLETKINLSQGSTALDRANSSAVLPLGSIDLTQLLHPADSLNPSSITTSNSSDSNSSDSNSSDSNSSDSNSSDSNSSESHSSKETASAISDGNATPDLGDSSNLLPLHFHWIEHGSLVVHHDRSTQATANAFGRNLILRALTTLPAGQLQMTIVDPDGLGRDFSWLMSLADADPSLVNHRVWTQSSHIQEQLAKLSHQTEDIIQQCLRDRFRDLREYNAAAGAMAEPFRLVVWSGFPIGLDEQSWRHLSALISSGARCGVAVLLLRDESQTNENTLSGNTDLSRIDDTGLHVDLRKKSLNSGDESWPHVLGKPWQQFPLRIATPPSESLQSQLLEIAAEDALDAGRIEVPFSAIQPAPDNFHSQSTADAFVVPLGQSGVGRIHKLRLGKGTAQHSLIAGKTGSGKSSLLHTLITSSVLAYSPEELRLVLLDFKKGVEFQIYAEMKLPHADVIGIESQREFGLSTLEYLDRLMQRRGEMFRAEGVQDIAAWRAKCPDRPMPRVLTVIDEFQELFVEDDNLGQHASMLLDRIVRQGRSFGMHIVLASQTLGGAYSLPRTTLAQMAVRIALQCEGADAMLILSEDNLAAERLRHSGQAIYNDAGGRIEGNQPFQVAYVTQDTQRQLLHSFAGLQYGKDSSNDLLTEQVVFAGHHAAKWDSNLVELAIAGREVSTSPMILLGESVSIDPAVTFHLDRTSGKNILLVGSDERAMADALAAIVASIRRGQSEPNGQSPHSTDESTPSSQLPALLFLDGSRTDETNLQRLPELVKTLYSENAVVGPRNFEGALGELHRELNRRLQAESEESNFPTRALVISGLARFRELRKSDEFGFGENDSEAPSPDAMLQSILKDGPAVGIHIVCLADSMNTLNRWFNRQLLLDFEIRILSQMSANDSNHLIDSPAASRLGTNIALLSDDSSGRMTKFRPFRFSVFDDLCQWAVSSPKK